MIPRHDKFTYMKRAALLKFFIVAVALSITAVGCKRGPKQLTYIPGQGGGPGTQGPIDDGTGVGAGGVDSESLGSGGGIPAAPRPGDDAIIDREALRMQAVYFDFDSSVLKPSEVGKVETVAGYLAANPSHGVIIEGHCDERGTEEYNRALGERRAQSVREALVRMGADANRVHTNSMGEDLPADDGHNEAAWSKCRRGEFIVLKPKS